VATVKVYGRGDIEDAIRRFKKKCKKEGIIKDTQKASFYLKPSQKKRKKSLNSKKRRQY
jgi:small subunit ribosomal protein S21